ncbi:MAG: KOW domain-containing RNA-binding protein [Candidatus Metalachnospira sp.]|nr:KOW domain-containing RNA-binding protein [Candidatus Metalachnospira sp.]
MEYTVGQVVYSKSGHDKGIAFVVTEVEGDFLYLVDGKCRSIDKPKKKKIKHVQITCYEESAIKAKIENGEQLLNADFVKALKKYS